MIKPIASKEEAKKERNGMKQGKDETANKAIIYLLIFDALKISYNRINIEECELISSFNTSNFTGLPDRFVFQILFVERSDSHKESRNVLRINH